MRSVLWVGDAGVPSGFAKATHEIGDRISQDFPFAVLGINYRGDSPSGYDYPIYTAAAGGDMFGCGRLVEVCDRVRPNLIVFQNDGWNFPAYVKEIKKYKEYADIPLIAVVAVDGKNFRKEWLDGFSHAIFWTNFALNEARAGGYLGPASVIPLGVDLTKFFPIGRKECRKRIFGIEVPDDIFIVGSVNRNQPRKRWDLLIKYFANWVHRYNIKNALLHLHTAPTGDTGIDVEQLAEYYKIKDMLALRQPSLWYGVSEEEMCDTYNCFDVFATTTQGEGFGLTVFEAMACGVPGIAPDWSALGELCDGACWLVPCPTTHIGPPYVNVVGGVPDEEAFVESLHAMYLHREYREAFSKLGLRRVEEDRFNWNNIAARYAEVFEQFVHEPVKLEHLHA